MVEVRRTGSVGDIQLFEDWFENLLWVREVFDELFARIPKALLGEIESFCGEERGFSGD